MSRITNDVGYVQGAVSEAVTSLLKDSFTLIGLVICYLLPGLATGHYRHVRLSSYYIPYRQVRSKNEEHSDAHPGDNGKLTTLLQETIAGTRIVKAFSMEDYENQRFGRENEHLFKLP